MTPVTHLLAACAVAAASGAIVLAMAGTAAAADQTYQGHYVSGGMDCKVYSVMVVGTDGQPHSTIKTVCEPIKK